MKAPNPNRRPAAPSVRRPPPVRSRSRRGSESEPPRPLPDGLERPRVTDAPPGYVANVKRDPDPVDPVDPPAPPAPAAQSLASQLEVANMQLLGDGPLPLEIASDESGGAFFVRMVSPMNFVRAIPVGAVCNRLCNGWRFIEGEPVIPRVNCATNRQDVCDRDAEQGWSPRGRALAATPTTTIDAVRVWIAEFMRDSEIYGRRPDLNHSFGRRLVSQIQKRNG